jgi:hypothetical protein
MEAGDKAGKVSVEENPLAGRICGAVRSVIAGSEFTRYLPDTTRKRFQLRILHAVWLYGRGTQLAFGGRALANDASSREPVTMRMVWADEYSYDAVTL